MRCGAWARFHSPATYLFASAIVVDKFTWPWLFAMPVIFAAVAFVLSLRAVGNSRERAEGRFDTGGSLLSALAIGGIVLGIHEDRAVFIARNEIGVIAFSRHRAGIAGIEGHRAEGLRGHLTG